MPRIQKRFTVFQASERGFSHKAKDIPCQDAASCYPRPERCAAMGIAVVADGHGGEKYFRSDTGSRLAAQIAQSEILESYKKLRKEAPELFAPATAEADKQRYFLETNLKRIKDNIIRRWRKAVDKDIRKREWTPAERAFCAEKKIDLDKWAADQPEKLVSIYGATLLAALITDDFWCVMQIGDGLCVLIDEAGQARPALAPDTEQAFGYTYSICAANAAEKFHHKFGHEPILGITVATDGVVDSFLPEKYLEFNRQLRENFLTDKTTAQTELEAWLPQLSEQGSRDDVAIAGIFQSEKEKMTI